MTIHYRFRNIDQAAQARASHAFDQEPRGAPANLLIAARPMLIARVNREGNRRRYTAHICPAEHNIVTVEDEGYDPRNSPLGCPVYWRIVRREDGTFYYSTFQATRDLVRRIWGQAGLLYCDPSTGLAFARIETFLR
jgi:hypothetical protein